MKKYRFSGTADFVNHLLNKFLTIRNVFPPSVMASLMCKTGLAFFPRWNRKKEIMDLCYLCRHGKFAILVPELAAYDPKWTFRFGGLVSFH